MGTDPLCMLVMSDSLQPECSSPGSSIHGILQARILEWVAILFSRGTSNPWIKPRSPILQADSLPSDPPGKPFSSYKPATIISTLSMWYHLPWMIHKSLLYDSLGGMLFCWVGWLFYTCYVLYLFYKGLLSLTCLQNNLIFIFILLVN